jgi:hypothetical protein
MSNEAADVSWLFDTWLQSRLTKKYQAETKSFYMDDETAPERIILFPVTEPKLTTGGMLVTLRDGKPTQVSSTTWEKYSMYVKKNPPKIHIDISSHNVKRNRPRRNPGKFHDTVTELLYRMDHDQTVGSVSEDGYWYGLVSGLLRPEANKLAEEFELDLSDWADDAKNYDWPLNAVITEDDAGFVEVYPFKKNKDAMNSWRKIIRDFDTKLDER